MAEVGGLAERRRAGHEVGTANRKNLLGHPLLDPQAGPVPGPVADRQIDPAGGEVDDFIGGVEQHVDLRVEDVEP